MRVVAFEGEVLETEVEQVLHLGVQPHGWQRAQLTGELQFGLFEVIAVQVFMEPKNYGQHRGEKLDLSLSKVIASQFIWNQKSAHSINAPNVH